MNLRNWFRPPRHLLAMFLGITVVSTVALAWLSWELVRQDRALAVQRAQEQRESAAGLAVAALQKQLSAIEERLTAFAALPDDELMSAATEFSRGLPDDSVLLIMRPKEVEAHPAGRLLYYPVLPAPPEAPTDLFSPAEAAEFQQKNYEAAVTALKGASSDANAAVRAEALVRLGRNHRKAARWDEAMTVYEDLGQIHHVSLGGTPVDLLARAAMCDLLESRSVRDRLQREAASLYSDLQHGRWRVSRAVYDVYAGQMRRILGADAAPLPAASAIALSEAVQALWQDWKDEKDAHARQTLWLADQSMLVLTKRAVEHAIVLVVGGEYISSAWLPELQPLAEAHHSRLALTDSDGHIVIGRVASHPEGVALRGPSATGLPWTVHAVSIGAGTDPEGFSLRSRLVLGGLLAIALLVIGGSYLIARAVARELAVARLQSDFVTAVSHEFRTPLTAMRQFSEMLAKGRVPNDNVRQQCYEVMEHESARLHRLVEGLLNFGRMQAGAMRYQFEPIDAAELLRSIVAEFRTQAERRGCHIELNVNGTVALTRADRNALGCVVWNLLDNAVKYSPDCRTVWLELTHEPGRIAIRVRDEGVGIPPEEQERIFQKFVRGQNAGNLGVQGAGIGLAVAREIVATHGGEIRLESMPGVGSTFTVLLPAATSILS